MVRVGSLFDLSQISPDKIDNRTGMTPMQQLQKIYQVIPELIARKNEIYEDVSEKLNRCGIFDLTFDQLTVPEQKYIHQYFKRYILPVLSPQIVDSHHPFPHLANKALYIAVLLKSKKGRSSLGFLPVPSSPTSLCFHAGQPREVNPHGKYFAALGTQSVRRVFARRALLPLCDAKCRY